MNSQTYSSPWPDSKKIWEKLSCANITESFMKAFWSVNCTGWRNLSWIILFHASRKNSRKENMKIACYKSFWNIHVMAGITSINSSELSPIPPALHHLWNLKLAPGLKIFEIGQIEWSHDLMRNCIGGKVSWIIPQLCISSASAQCDLMHEYSHNRPHSMPYC